MAPTPRLTSVYTRAVAIGLAAGLRTLLPFALLSLSARGGAPAARSAPLDLLRSPAALLGLSLAGTREMLAATWPLSPRRHELAPMVGRALLGGVAGAAITIEAGHSGAVGAVFGATGAAFGADGGYHARVFLGRVTGVPDPVWGILEDGLALALGLVAVRPATAAGADLRE